MPMAELLSAHTPSSTSTPRSRATDTRPAPSAASLMILASSASPELRAMVFCVEGQCLILRAPHMAAPPQVERRAATQP
eukprot:6755815-Alexandrium_andersonii.AAC.1